MEYDVSKMLISCINLLTIPVIMVLLAVVLRASKNARNTIDIKLAVILQKIDDKQK